MSTRKQVVGNLAFDPELKFGQSGTAWATFTVISNEGKDDKAVKCVTRCKAFGELAENVTASLTKGTRVIVSGREQTEEWDKDGEKRSANVLIVDAIGPDLRYAQAQVTRMTKVMSGSGKVGQVATTSSNDPWASVPPPTEEPAW
mgnify:CR=1 FL=1